MKKEFESSIKLKYDIAMGIAWGFVLLAVGIVSVVVFSYAPAALPIFVPIACIASIFSVIFAEAFIKERLYRQYKKCNFVDD